MTGSLRRGRRKSHWFIYAAFIFIVCIGMLYLGVQIIHLPKAGSGIGDVSGDVDQLEKRVHELEADLRQNSKMVGEIISIVRDLLRENATSRPPALTQDAFHMDIPVTVRDEKRNQMAASVEGQPKEIGSSSGKCHDDGLVLGAKKSDINVYDMYDAMKFDNVDGGVWKQGFQLDYDAGQWSPANKLQVFIVPHSHNDPGWIKTVEKYYTDQTENILDGIVMKLSQNSKFKFIWAEMSYLSMWWTRTSIYNRNALVRLVKSGQLEIVTGGWVMNDEANTHYYAMLSQMIEGNEWLNNHLNVTPKAGWAIDPFGLSPTMAYLLRRMDFDMMVIQRVHYALKKELAYKRQLEVKWRQLWDGYGTTDIYCHVMPFYSYDVPHTCGPDPKVCCQFDFARSAGSKLNCPWKINPRIISDFNVAERANTLLDQYRKKAQLFGTNVLLVQLGDDFRYDKMAEFDAQFTNYVKLMEYINNKEDMHAVIKFGTLSDYYTAVKAQIANNTAFFNMSYSEDRATSKNSQRQLPSLAGDFFTYADRDDHYWSGYYTSRPFYKHLDRVVEAYVRGAEIIHALTAAKMAGITNEERRLASTEFLTKSLAKLVGARRNLGLFQHHDGITGTSKSHVVVDYGTRLVHSIRNMQGVISNCTHYLLNENDEFGTSTYQADEIWKSHNGLPDEPAVNIPLKPETDNELKRQPAQPTTVEFREVVLYNSLTIRRKEVVIFKVNSAKVCVKNGRTGEFVPAQTMPSFRGRLALTDEFMVAFVSDVPALGHAVYKLMFVEETESCRSASTISFTNWEHKLPMLPFKVENGTGQPFILETNLLKARFDANGILSGVSTTRGDVSADLSLEFGTYGARSGKERSGAYLFLPDDDAKVAEAFNIQYVVIKGPILSRVTVYLDKLEHNLLLKNSTLGFDGMGLEMYNLVDIRQDSNTELIMRLRSSVKNKDFDTDLNGFQMARRKVHSKLPLQGNVYPMASQISISDDRYRLSVLSAQPLGATSLHEGVIDVFLDRRLNQDDNRGLEQPILDNLITPNRFRILLERNPQPLPTKIPLVTIEAHMALNTLLYPLFKLVDTSRKKTSEIKPGFEPLRSDFLCNIHLVTLRSEVGENELGTEVRLQNTSGVVLHRLGTAGVCEGDVGLCAGAEKGGFSFREHFGDLFRVFVEETSLNFRNVKRRIGKAEPVKLKPMELHAFRVRN